MPVKRDREFKGTDHYDAEDGDAHMYVAELEDAYVVEISSDSAAEAEMIKIGEDDMLLFAAWVLGGNSDE
jgi:hypothetical protein